MKAEVISVGTELLLGDITDTNATHIAQKLRSIGLDLLYRSTVGDNEQRIAEVVNRALERVDVVIVTGGLGPTVDDVTREGIARATGRPLVFQPALLEQIAARFARFNVMMSENNRRQAFLPQGALPIENPVGTAPIFILETERGVVMVLPGVPREMEYMLENALLPWLRAHLDAPAVIKSLVLRTAGVGESQIDAQIADMMTMSNPTVGLAAHSGQTDIRITAKAADEAAAEALIAPVEAEIRSRIGHWIYGTGSQTIEEVVVDLLRDRSASAACVEVNTGGQLCRRLEAACGRENAPPFTCEVLDNPTGLQALGVPVGLSLEDTARAAAEAMRGSHGTTYGLAVMIDEGSPGGGASLAVAFEDGVRSRIFGGRHTVIDAQVWAATQALALLRRVILKVSAQS
jgi:nicotinamide-nucleotide amidase